MFDLSPEKILVIGLIAIMVLGPNRLPNAARTLAKVLHQLRTASGSLQAEMREVLAEPRQAINEAVGDLGLPTDLSIPRMPTARSLVSQVLGPEPVPAGSRPVEGRPVEASNPGPAVVEASLPGAVPDDPSFN